MDKILKLLRLFLTFLLSFRKYKSEKREAKGLEDSESLNSDEKKKITLETALEKEDTPRKILKVRRKARFPRKSYGGDYSPPSRTKPQLVNTAENQVLFDFFS